MKLRNKKTGVAIVLIDHIFDNYNSLAEVMDEWEDYKPAEPLIKDEKIRNAVKSFFALIGATEGIYYQAINNCFYYTDNDGISYGIDFDNIRGIEDIHTHIEYTITELCGEEEE